MGKSAPNLVLHDVDDGDWTSLASVDLGAAGAASLTARVLPLVANGEGGSASAGPHHTGPAPATGAGTR